MENLTTFEINNYSIGLKDDLCRLYNYIERHSGNNEGYLKLINFTEEGIHWAFVNLSLDGNPNKKYVNKFFNNLDLIRELTKYQPSKLVEFTEKKYDIKGEEIIEKYQIEYKSFDHKDMMRRILIEKGSLKTMKIISEKN